MLAAFLLAFPALFSIVNPIAGAFIFREATSDRSHDERVALARRVGLYSLLVMLGALLGGSLVLEFFGVSIEALRIAGGLVLALFAWELLGTPEKRESRKQEQANDSGDDPAFFPLTLPFTTGPGTIAVAITLGANRPEAFADRLGFYGGVSLAALCVAVIVALVYASADRVVALIGPVRARVAGRLFAFLLLCVGTQILVTGLKDTFASIAR
jgi:multiple antibiotic resistance protein